MITEETGEGADSGVGQTWVRIAALLLAAGSSCNSWGLGDGAYERGSRIFLLGGYKDGTIQLPDLANRNTGCSVKSEFQINKESFFVCWFVCLFSISPMQ